MQSVPLMLWVWIPVRQAALDTTLCDKVCQWLAAGRWFSPGLDPEISTVIAVCLGKKGTGYNDLEGLDEGRDQIRNAVARL
jgi:hypothetical protein